MLIPLWDRGFRIAEANSAPIAQYVPHVSGCAHWTIRQWAALMDQTGASGESTTLVRMATLVEHIVCEERERIWRIGQEGRCGRMG